MSKYIVPNKHNGFSPAGERLYFKGGGGGGGSSYYKNLNELYGAQSKIASGVYNNVYAPYAPGAVADLESLRNEAFDGTLAARARAQAGADAGAALGQGLDAATRGLDRFGANMNANALSAQMASAGLAGAGMKVGAMNNANNWAENQKWGRSFDFYNSLSGIPTQSAGALGQAAGGMGAAGNAQTAANAQSSAGWGTGLAYMGSQMFKADGGYIDGKEQRLASGGKIKPVSNRVDKRLWLDRVDPQLGDASSGKSGGGLEGLLPYASLGLSGLGLYLKHGDKIKGMFAGKDPTPDMPRDTFTDDQFTSVASIADTPSYLAVTDVPDASAGLDAVYGADGMVSAGADAAAEGVKVVADGAGAASDIASWFPYPSFQKGGLVHQPEQHFNMGRMVTKMNGLEKNAIPEVGKMSDPNIAVSGPPGAGGGGSSGGGDSTLSTLSALASIGRLFFLANGGEVGLGGRKNMIPGGPVNGPGTETSDSIPARLSDGEYVLNSEAVKMIGKKKLDALNKKGLERRRAKGG